MSKLSEAISNHIALTLQDRIQQGIPADSIRDQLRSRVLPPATASNRGGVVLSDTVPLAIGTASAGVATTVARNDHVHADNGHILIVDTKSAGTAGGTFTSGVWRTRILNTERYDTHNDASVASNQITLSSGVYRCNIIAPVGNVDLHQARLYDITHSTVILTGMNAFNYVPSVIVGRFTLVGTTVIEVQHQCQTTGTFGSAINGVFTVSEELYTIAEFWKE